MEGERGMKEIILGMTIVFMLGGTLVCTNILFINIIWTIARGTFLR